MRESGKISGKRVWEMSGTFLKCVALAAMFADHLLKILLTQPFFMQVCGMSLEASWALLHSPLFYALELFGRMAFPIFAFSVAQGSRHTHSRERYLLRLLLVGLISEIPFQLAFEWGEIGLGTTNVFFTLLLGACVCMLFEHCARKNERSAWLLFSLVLLMAVYIAEYMHMDYGWYGVFCIFLLYAVRNRLLLGALLTVLTALLYGAPFSADAALLFIAAMGGYALLLLYNGARGRPMKWLFYAFYPAHLIVLYGAAYLLGIG